MEVTMPRELLEAMLSLARQAHPREVVLLLRGELREDGVEVSEFLFPPLATGGRGFASFPVHMLPIDFSIIGTAHSHPNGVPRPSVGDMNNFYSRVMVIMGAPYTPERTEAYNKRGERISLTIRG